MSNPESPTPDSAAPAGSPTGKPRVKGRKRRIAKWVVRLLLGIPLFLGLVTLLLMRSPVVKWTLEKQVRELTGCELEAGGAYIDLDGRLVVRDFALRTPAVPGDAGRFLAAPRVVLDIDWSPIFGGEVRVDALRLEDPKFILSQSLEDSDLNIASVVSQTGSAGSGTSGSPSKPMTPPRVDALNAEIVFAEHDRAGNLSPLRTLKVDGSFTPADMRSVAYVIRMQETGRRGMILDGRVDLQAGSSVIRLLNVDLATWTPETIPTAYRTIWRRLNVQGAISSATLAYGKGEGPRLEVVVDDVSMALLIPEEADIVGPTRDLGIRGVNGAIRLSPAGLRADLTGAVQGQEGRSRVRLQTQGLDLNAALTCEIMGRRFVVTSSPEFLSYIPPTARQYFSIFSGPTGEVDARVTISRPPPENGRPAPIRVTGGRLALTNGSAAFHRFPYRFEQMAGYVEFDDRTIKIINMTGRGSSGAVLKASGIISPLTDDAMVDVTVNVTNVPVDEELLEAMPRDKKDVVEQIFNKPEYERLIAAGLLKAPKGESPADALPFDFAGTCNVDIHVQRPEGADVDWITIVDVSFPTAGLVVEPFPLPVTAKDLKVHITDDDARLVSGSFRTITGGTAEVLAEVVFFENGTKVLRPLVRISSGDLPIDRFLLHALPLDDQPEPGAPEQLQVGKVLRALNMSGTIAATAEITAAPEPPATLVGPREKVTTINYDVGISLADARGLPAPEGETPALELREVAGSMRISREKFSIGNLTARLFRRDAGAPDAPQDCSATLAITLDSALENAPYDVRGRLDATINADGLDLSAPIEQVVAIFSPGGAKTLAELRAEREPVGRVDVETVLMRLAGETGAPGAAIELERAAGVEFAALGGRMMLDSPTGVIHLDIPSVGFTRTAFDDVRLGLTLNGRPCGSVRLDGWYTVDPKSGAVSAPADLIAELTDWRFESPLILPVISRLAGETPARSYTDFSPTGAVDALITLNSDPRADVDPARTPHPARLGVSFAPRTLSFTYNKERIELSEVSGRVTLNTTTGDGPRGVFGVLEHIHVVSEHWQADGDGEWFATSGDAAALRIDMDFEIQASELDPSLRAMLPDAAASTLTAIDAEFNGPFALRKGHVKTTLGAAAAAADANTPGSGAMGVGATHFAGTLEFQNLSFSAGVPVDHCTGVIDLSVSDPGGPKSDAAFRAAARIPAMRVLGVGLSDAAAEITSGSLPGEILLPSLSAKVHGGRLQGTARALAPTTDAKAETVPNGSNEPSYSVELVMAGVKFAPVLADVAAAGAAPEGPVGPPDPFTEPDPSRGSIDARVSLSGIAGRPHTRTGTGAIRIADGDVLRMPVILAMIQLSNFQLPWQDRLGLVRAEFHVAGDEAEFDHIEVASNSVSILGTGTLNLSDLTLDMRFNSRSNRRVPLLSDVFEALRDEFLSTTVTGSITEPDISSEVFMGTRRMIETLLTGNARFGTLDRTSPDAARAQREALRRDGGEVVPTIHPLQEGGARNVGSLGAAGPDEDAVHSR